MLNFQQIKSFFDVYSGNSDQDSIEQSLIDVISTLSVYPRFAKLAISSSEIRTLAETFAKIGLFFQTKFESLEVSSDTQKMTTTNFHEIFVILKNMNIHQNVDSTSYEVAYPKVQKEPICKCAFHEEELFDHLHICSIVAGTRAIRSAQNVFLATLTGLLHDIGKPACIRIFNGGNIGYPFHGEYGSMILSRIYHPDFAQFISKDEYETMCRAISIHMCSYHIVDFQSNWSQNRANSTRIETDSVKSILNCLSFGDVFGAFSELNDYDIFLSSRSLYNELISQKYETTKCGYAFFVRGRSGSGKSFVSNLLKNLLESLGLKVAHIERDLVICNTVRKIQNLPELSVRPTESDYASYHSFYKQNKLSSQVNKEMNEKFKYYLALNYAVIIDTQLSMFRGFEQVVPDSISNCICIALDVSRNMLIDDDSKNGVTLQTQLTMFGDSSVLKPFDLTGTNIFSLSSAYTHNQRPVGISPDFVFSISYNQHYIRENSIGFAYFSNFMKEIHSITNIPKKIFFTIGVISDNSQPTLSELSINSSGTKDTNDMNLVEYINHLYSSNENSYDSVIQILKSQYYHVGAPSQLKNMLGTSPARNLTDDSINDEKNFISIKYLDHNNNWNTWGRESRGSTLALIDGKWTMFKYLMERGAEMLTGMQMKRGIDKTDNIDTKMDFKASHLSRVQQELIQDLREGNPVDLVLSFKKDGSLLSCALYTGSMGVLMRRLINTYCDDFTKAVMTEYDKISGNSDVFVFQSQSTLFIGDAMYDYTTTAIFPEAIPTLTPLKKIQTYGESFMTKLKKMFDNIDGDIKQILGETICANRTESYSGNVHKELAMSYPTSSFTILSITSIKDNHYTAYPHYMYSEIINYAGFTEPAFWKCSSVAQVDKLIQDVDSFIFGKINCDEFYQINVPSNIYSYEKIIDCEGFVTYDVKRNNSYGKIKTDSYYKSHKLRDDNIPFLCELNKVVGHIFPLARIVDETISKLNEKLDLINPELVKVITSAEMKASLPDKALNGFDNRPRPVQFKIIINNAKNKFSELAFAVFQTHFPSLMISDEMKTFVVSYAMNTELWLDIPKPIDEQLKSELVYNLINMSH